MSDTPDGVERRGQDPGRPHGRTPLDWAADVVATPPRRIAIHMLLLAATVFSTLYVGAALVKAYDIEIAGGPGADYSLLDGWPYAATLMTILLFHEMGHYAAARIHGVPVSLPYFIPVPFFFGTFGAVIRTRGRIRSRNALMDIGAAGPIAGLAVAVPAMIFGLSLSEVRPLPAGSYQLEGQSLLYVALKRVVLGDIPQGHDVFLHPLAWASWIGFLVTMINLIPVGQLDGGHVSYALLGRRYARVSRWAHVLLVALGAAVCGVFGVRAILAGRDAAEIAAEFATGTNWLVWAAVLWLLFRTGERRRPPFERDDALTPARKVLGVACILLFLLLFMAVPLRAVEP